jgi:hypothetical protein
MARFLNLNRRENPIKVSGTLKPSKVLSYSLGQIVKLLFIIIRIVTS